jgi:hypothetical protein
MDDAGHIIHIDFGFMLSNSPGGVNFEAAPFKLTRELLEIMDSNSEGHASEVFDYFKVRLLCLLELPAVLLAPGSKRACTPGRHGGLYGSFLESVERKLGLWVFLRWM